ncbi:MAG: cofactor-independent phosphoglycerate mutase, partial [Chloroflexota bacterium]
EDEAAFRCNLVAVHDGRMSSYSAGHITSREAAEIIATLNDRLGDARIRFFAGTSYRHLVKIAGGRDTLRATCTPPHDISGQPVEEFLPRGPGSGLLRELMQRSQAVLKDHPVNAGRRARGETPATMIWLFWGSGRPGKIPSFCEVHGLTAALTSGVDLLRGLARMIDVEILEIAGVTDNLDNDYAAQAGGALEALGRHDLAVIHVEAPDEAGHAGSISDKIAAIESVDKEIVARVRSRGRESFRVLVMPDHPTPIAIRTHYAEPVPFLLWGDGFSPSGARRFTEAEAKATGISIVPGHTLLRKLITG